MVVASSKLSDEGGGGAGGGDGALGEDCQHAGEHHRTQRRRAPMNNDGDDLDGYGGELGEDDRREHAVEQGRAQHKRKPSDEDENSLDGYKSRNSARASNAPPPVQPIATVKIWFKQAGQSPLVVLRVVARHHHNDGWHVELKSFVSRADVPTLTASCHLPRSAPDIAHEMAPGASAKEPPMAKSLGGPCGPGGRGARGGLLGGVSVPEGLKHKVMVRALRLWSLRRDSL